MHRIGYLVPEFPGQTHSFFWRELRALAGMEVEAELVSTRRPARGVNAHDWGAEAMARTVYLTDRDGASIAGAVAAIARAFPGGWIRCLGSIRRAQGLDRRGRIRLIALAVLGGRLAALARARGWSHVHVHSCADSAHIAMFARQLSGLSYSLTLHGPLGDYGPNQHEKWRHATFALIITRQLHAATAEALGDAFPARTGIAPMGVDLDDFRRTAGYSPWRGAGPLRILSCGRLNPGKGHADLIAAVGIVRAKGIDARLSICGEDEGGGGGYRQVLTALIADSGAVGVTLLGAVDEHVLRGHLEAAHIFALASLAEPLGVAIMEAMAMELPVVVTGAGGVPELVDDGIDGVLVPPGDPRAMAAQLIALARDPARAAELGAAGRRKIAAGFSSTRGAAMLAQMLDGGAA
ncbi:exopolysaccharide biosynthesis GT4 family glycosyltransferase EpsE [Sphingomonas arantia]|uniref:Exopolysaccharide biosynthesis GT4 family glycosyltransferase EpsE n=1 Tax=Sphingomonas arantia TaxID=1460676 RepID=A0ABW4U498_9SPHN